MELLYVTWAVEAVTPHFNLYKKGAKRKKKELRSSVTRYEVLRRILEWLCSRKARKDFHSRRVKDTNDNKGNPKSTQNVMADAITQVSGGPSRGSFPLCSGWFQSGPSTDCFGKRFSRGSTEQGSQENTDPWSTWATRVSWCPLNHWFPAPLLLLFAAASLCVTCCPLHRYSRPFGEWGWWFRWFLDGIFPLIIPLSTGST